MTYLDWLKNQVEYFDGYSHNILLDKLYAMSYTPILERDKNRYDDGVALRDDFFSEVDPDQNVIDSPCSFLEFLIGLARRMNYIYAMPDEDRTQDCFWMMINNLGINFSDVMFKRNSDLERQIVEVVGMVNNRTYREDGLGNTFPLNSPRTNQRNVEVWYQMNQYLTELMHTEGRL